MSRRGIKEIMDTLPVYAGENGAVLAQTLIKTFAGVGRGVRARAVVIKLADDVEHHTIEVERGAWVFTDAKGRKRALGSYGDEVLPAIVDVAVQLHERPFARKSRPELPPWVIAEGILLSARFVEGELVRRRRIEKIRSFIRSLLPFQQR